MGALTALLGVGCHAAAPVSSSTSVPACTAADLRLTVDPDREDFNGMMHSGLYFSLENTTTRACRISRWPVLRFRARNNQPLMTRIDRVSETDDVSESMILLPGEQRRGSLRWVSGDAYGAGNCQETTGLYLSDASRSNMPITATLCAPAGQAPGIEQKPLSETRAD